MIGLYVDILMTDYRLTINGYFDQLVSGTSMDIMTDISVDTTQSTHKCGRDSLKNLSSGRLQENVCNSIFT